MGNIILKDQLNEKAKIQIEKIKEIRKTVNGEDSFFENKKDIYNFQQIDITRSFFQSIFSGKTTLNTANPDQINLVVQFIKFKKQAKSVLEQKKKHTHTQKKKKHTFKIYICFFRVINTLKSGIFPFVQIESTECPSE